MWTERIGRGCEIRKISLARTEKICPLASSPLSDSSATASGAILAVVMRFIFSTRACCSGVSVGIEAIMRDQAKGAMQFDRTLKRCMSSAIDFDSAATPSFAAE